MAGKPIKSPFNFETEAAEPVEGCKAWVGLGQSCHEPALPGRNVCRFHDSFAGPWIRFVHQPKAAKPPGRSFRQRLREFLHPQRE
jgi:hypothetical protein